MRRSCHTIARCSGSPLRLSQATTVSRWFVMPTAAQLARVDAGGRERLAGDGA